MEEKEVEIEDLAEIEPDNYSDNFENEENLVNRDLSDFDDD